MSFFRQTITNVLASFILIMGIALSNTALGLTTNSVTNLSSFSLNQKIENSHHQDLNKYVVISKRVCRYIDHVKRCWDE